MPKIFMVFLGSFFVSFYVSFMNLYKVICPECRDEVYTNRSHREYCGPRCRMRVARARKKGARAPMEDREITALNPSENKNVKVIKYSEHDKKRRLEREQKI